MHAIIKAGCSERDNVFKINVYASAFTLIDRLALKKNKEAATVYKTMISALIDLYRKRTLDQIGSQMLL